MSKLLMIDDNPLEHLVMQKMLDRYDLFQDASHSSDARASVDLLRKNCNRTSLLPDLIFLDLDMPEFNGWDFMREFELLYSSFKKPISIYIISSSVDRTDRANASRFPFVKDFFSKPIGRERLETIYKNYHNTSKMAG